MVQSPNDYDSPWKESLENYFPQFMEFFFPAIFAEIHWDRGYEFLNIELQQIVRDAALGTRLADKLVKVWRINGEETWVLIHIEIQGQQRSQFAQRMYIYNYRIGDRFNRPTVSLAVLTDDSPNWRPNQYQYQLWGCRMQFEFPVVKLLDFASQWDVLEASDNPFATVVMAHLKSRSTQGNPTEGKIWKLYLVKRLYERGYSRDNVYNLFRFINWLIALPAELEKSFLSEVERYQEERQMPYITNLERVLMEQNREEGLQQGLEQGREEGREQGLEQGRERVAINLLATGMSLEEIARVSELPLDRIQQLQAEQPSNDQQQ